MNKIESYSELLLKIAEIRNFKNGFITNFYPNEFRANIWMENELLESYQGDETYIFIVKNSGFTTLYFCSTSIDKLKTCISNLDIDNTLVLDIVTNGSDSPLIELFKRNGYFDYCSLVRMSRVGQLPEKDKDEMVQFAKYEDISQIKNYFDNHFDKLSEQIPTRKELERWIDRSEIIVCIIDNIIVGYLIYDLIGVTLYLRYWFVSPEYRDKKVGSKLFNEFINCGKDSKRQVLWVITTNENAIKRYIHFGFKEEKMFDTVLIKK